MITTAEYQEFIDKFWDELQETLDTELEGLELNEEWHNKYEEITNRYNRLLGPLSRAKRMNMEITLSEIPTYGDRMSLKDFIECVECGGFIDYDGSGNYLEGEQMTNIIILPSDIKHNSIRKEFAEIIWFNK